jgi:predicted nucleotidyltransferase component of viral defense system
MMEEKYKKYNFTEIQMNRALVMEDIAKEITKDEKAALVLKGGTALMLCYNLPRFSSDLDYDGANTDIHIEDAIKKGAAVSGRKAHMIILKKNTDTVKRYMVHYKEWENEPLKIEISFRNRDNIGRNDFTNVHGIRVYTIANLIEQKFNTFCDRYKARDMYDVAFLLEHYPQMVPVDLLKKSYARVQSLGLDYMEKVMKGDPVFENYDCEKILLKMEGRMEEMVNGVQNSSGEKKGIRR